MSVSVTLILKRKISVVALSFISDNVVRKCTTVYVYRRLFQLEQYRDQVSRNNTPEFNTHVRTLHADLNFCSFVHEQYGRQTERKRSRRVDLCLLGFGFANVRVLTVPVTCGSARRRDHTSVK